MKKIIFLCLLSPIVNLAQNVTVTNDYCFGGSGDDVLYSVLHLSNGNKLLIGASNSGISGTKSENSFGSYDGYIVMLNAANQELWQKTIGGSEEDSFWDGIELPDGSILLGGTTYSGISGNKTSVNHGANDTWVVRIDLNGNILFDQTYGGSATESFSSGMVVLGGNSVIISTSSSSDISGNKTSPAFGSLDTWIFKIDFNGNLLNQVTLGGSSIDSGGGLIVTDSMTIITSNYSSSNISGNKTENSIGGGDIWLVKLDSELNILDQKTIGGDMSDTPFNILQAQSNRFLVACSSDSGTSGDKTSPNYGGIDTWILEIDSNFNLINQVSLGSDYDDFFNNIYVYDDLTYAVTIASNSTANSIKSQSCINGSRDLWIVKLNSSLQKDFDVVLGTAQNDTGIPNPKGNIQLNTFYATSAGSANNNKTCSGYGSNDFWIIETNSYLGLTEETANNAVISPNPTTGKVTVDGITYSQIVLYASDGRKVGVYQSTDEIDLGVHENGIYLLQIFLKNGNTITKKVLKSN